MDKQQQLNPEQLFAKIGILVMENDILRVELNKIQQNLIEVKEELLKLKEK